MKAGITCGGIGPYATGEFIRNSAVAAEKAGFTHYLMPDHVVQFGAYPESDYPYAGGSGQDAPEPSDDAPLHFDDDTYANQDPRHPLIDPVMGMCWAAAATTTLEVGSNILVLPQRNPLFLAKSMATLDSFSNGRAILGVGAGWAKEEFDAVGVDFKQRGKRTNEAIEAMRRLWLDEYSTYQGEHFAFTNACSFPKPARKGGVQILIGGESKAAMRRIARLGDGWLHYNMPVGDAPQMIGEMKDMTRAEGRDPDSMRIIKIVYSSATLDDLKRYRDAGVTEFNIASSGEVPPSGPSLDAKFAEFAESVIGPIGEL
ncbi:MAG: LLM class F420-dependent oxidoreductase [Novosphingobium sp.]|nr:LLM class F420-dependent oxidoreductase [Novosphingobium sp.]